MSVVTGTIPGAKHIAVIGAGVGGLASAITLGRAGHTVTVFERDLLDTATSPDEAFGQQRRGAAQFRHSHAFVPQLRSMLANDYPDILRQLHEAGATDLRPSDAFPSSPQASNGDAATEDPTLLACRRSTFDWVLRRVAVSEPLVTLRDRSNVVALAGTPMRVSGVCLADGSTETFDLVVATNGRRCPLSQWLTEIGAPALREIHSDSSLLYFTRFYRLNYGHEEPVRSGPLVGDLGYLKYGVFPGDNGTFSITLASWHNDVELRRLLDDEVRFDAVARALPLTGPYLDGRSQPISGVSKVAGLTNRWQDFVLDGRPAAIGIVPVGDALMSTNPLYGRGCTSAFWSAQFLRNALAAHPEDLAAAALAYNADVQTHLRPWFESAQENDERSRLAMGAMLADERPNHRTYLIGRFAYLRSNAAPVRPPIMAVGTADETEAHEPEADELKLAEPKLAEQKLKSNPER